MENTSANLLPYVMGLSPRARSQDWTRHLNPSSYLAEGHAYHLELGYVKVFMSKYGEICIGSKDVPNTSNIDFSKIYRITSLTKVRPSHVYLTNRDIEAKFELTSSPNYCLQYDIGDLFFHCEYGAGRLVNVDVSYVPDYYGPLTRYKLQVIFGPTRPVYRKYWSHEDEKYNPFEIIEEPVIAIEESSIRIFSFDE